MSIHNKKKIKGAVQVSKKTTSQPDMMLNKVKKMNGRGSTRDNATPNFTKKNCSCNQIENKFLDKSRPI